MANGTLVYALSSGSISGTVYLDAKCNGLDLSDKPLAGVSATLTSKILKKSLVTKSDGHGNIRFNYLAYGFYSLKIVPGQNYRPQNKVIYYQLGEVNGTVSDNYVFCKSGNIN